MIEALFQVVAWLAIFSLILAICCWTLLAIVEDMIVSIRRMIGL